MIEEFRIFSKIDGYSVIIFQNNKPGWYGIKLLLAFQSLQFVNGADSILAGNTQDNFRFTD